MLLIACGLMMLTTTAAKISLKGTLLLFFPISISSLRATHLSIQFTCTENNHLFHLVLLILPQ